VGEEIDSQQAHRHTVHQKAYMLGFAGWSIRLQTMSHRGAETDSMAPGKRLHAILNLGAETMHGNLLSAAIYQKRAGAALVTGSRGSEGSRAETIWPLGATSKTTACPARIARPRQWPFQS
jgi:hypothetical protein